MSITTQTKDVGEVRDKFRKELGCPWKLEDGNEEYIKRELKIKC